MTIITILIIITINDSKNNKNSSSNNNDIPSSRNWFLLVKFPLSNTPNHIAGDISPLHVNPIKSKRIPRKSK